MHIKRVINLWTAGICSTIRTWDGLQTEQITKSLRGWIAEALELRNRGMPDDSFRLLLDGDPIPEKASQRFTAVKWDAARQAALKIYYTRGIFPQLSWIEKRESRWDGFHWEILPEAIRKLQDGGYESFIDCNFDLGAPYDAERLVEERNGWTLDDRQKEWSWIQCVPFETAPPLPPWRELHPFRRSKSIPL